MAKERLSKLQKWILSESYKLNILHDGSVVGRVCSHFYREGIAGYEHPAAEVSVLGKKYASNPLPKRI